MKALGRSLQRFRSQSLLLPAAHCMGRTCHSLFLIDAFLGEPSLSGRHGDSMLRRCSSLLTTQYAGFDIRGKTCRFLLGAATDPATVEAIRRALMTCEPLSGEILSYRRDKSAFWNEITITTVRSTCGHVTHFVGTILQEKCSHCSCPTPYWQFLPRLNLHGNFRR